MATIYQFKVGYTKLGVASAPVPAPTIDIVDSSDNLLVSAGITTALVNMPGVYTYSYTGADFLDVIGKFHTTDPTVDVRDLFSYTPFIFVFSGLPASVVGSITGQYSDFDLTRIHTWVP